MTRNTVKSLAKEIASEILKKDESKATVREAFEYYFRTKTISSATRDGKNSLYIQMEDKGYLDKPIQDMNGAAIREFIGQFNLMPSSAHSLYSRLIAVLGHYIREHNLKLELPKGLIKNPKLKDKTEESFITWEQIKMLLATDLEDKDQQFFVDLFCLLCLTGMSIKDSLNFTPQQNVSADEKWIIYARKKTGSRCQIPLFPQLKKIIDKYQWPCKYSVRTVQYRCTSLISDLLGRRVKSHDGRKAFGCLCLTLGWSIEATSKFMGHSNPLITSRIYAHVLHEKVQKEMEFLPAFAKEIMGL